VSDRHVYEGYETLIVERTGKIATITLNRPDVMNATNPLMHQELERAFPQLGRDPDVNVIILTGAGRCFSAGGDIIDMRDRLDDHVRWLEAMREARAILYHVVDLPQPLICKVNGAATGLGSTLALFSDIIVARDTAKIADTHVNVGLVAGDGGAVIWPALIGHARAKLYLLTGKVITGKEAAEIGLITEAVTAEELDARVQEIAETIAALPAVAVKLTKKSINIDLRQKLDMMIEAQLGYETMSHLSLDHREAINAFADKRTPVFTGK
jgi:enoyl-CoA hydratase